MYLTQQVVAKLLNLGVERIRYEQQMICYFSNHFGFDKQYSTPTVQATIYCINFNHQSTCIVVSSDHGTIHVFNLEEQQKSKESSSLQIIPKYFTSQWSFCKFSVPREPPCICAFGAENNSVIGECYYFSFDSDCAFRHQHQLIGFIMQTIICSCPYIEIEEQKIAIRANR